MRRQGPLNIGLALLALRRSLSPVVLVAWTVLLVVFFRYDWGGTSALLATTAGPLDAGAVSRGMSREGLWFLLILTIVPMLIVRAARVVPAWRSGEGDWIGSRSIGRLAVVASTSLGTWTGAALLLAASFTAIEVRAGPAGPSLRRAGALELPATAWIEAGAPLVWTARDPGDAAPLGARVRVELAFGFGSGSAAEVVFRAARLGAPVPASSERSASVRIASRGTVEVELPPGRGDLRLEIACPAEGTRAFVISDAAEIWIPCTSERAGSAQILLRLLPTLFAWIGLALGLSAWMSSASAALAILATWLAIWLGDALPAWLPAADLWVALDTVGSGRVPPGADARSHVLAIALGTLGIGLCVLGTRRWRTSP